MIHPDGSEGIGNFDKIVLRYCKNIHPDRVGRRNNELSSLHKLIKTLVHTEEKGNEIVTSFIIILQVLFMFQLSLYVNEISRLSSC